MLYWFGAYALVVIAIVLPFLALYTVVTALWFGPRAVRFMIRGLKALMIQTGLFEGTLEHDP